MIADLFSFNDNNQCAFPVKNTEFGQMAKVIRHIASDLMKLDYQGVIYIQAVPHYRTPVSTVHFTFSYLEKGVEYEHSGQFLVYYNEEAYQEAYVHSSV